MSPCAIVTWGVRAVCRSSGVRPGWSGRTRRDPSSARPGAGEVSGEAAGGDQVRRRRATRVICSVVALLAAASGLGYAVYVDPRTDRVSARDPADAVVALAGVPRPVATARALVEQGVA